MLTFPPELTDELCHRQCAFALYALPGGGVEFCMQADGGMQPGISGKGFVLATYEGEPSIILSELSNPPAAEQFPLLPQKSPKQPATTREEYHRLFELYTTTLRSGSELNKLVLARTEDFPTRQFSPTAAFCTLCRTAPSAFNALFHTAEHGTWLCSTPETLLHGEGEQWRTMALAGSRSATETKWDAKNMREHSLVAQHILSCISPYAEAVETQGPLTVSAGRMLQHLCTNIRFRMQPQYLPELLTTLPPTPAVSGFPAMPAREFLRSHPDIDRSCYAGYLGPVAENAAHLFVTLRCMQVFHDRCRLYAGGGLMPDSQEEAEWAETTLKMQAMAQLLAF